MKGVYLMKVMQNLRNKLQGLIQATSRYPLKALFLIALASVVRETDKVRIRFIVLGAGEYGKQYNGNFYVYIDFK